ncbi:MAG: efflux RND transporter permease subunit [bacterium]|nr:efflux RND transporter permease subunit [bacterium]
MERLPKLSLNNRAFIALVCVVITVIGVISMTVLRRELIPSIQLPAVAVVATNPGASSQQMADTVADPIERNLRTLDNVAGTQAVSRSNFTMLTVELDYGSDIYRAASQTDVILGRLESQLPEGTTTEVITGGTGSLPAMIVAASSDLEPFELVRRLELAAVPDIGSVEGVATVDVLGAPEEVIRLTLDEAALAEAGLNRGDIISALDDAGLVIPGGQVGDGGQQLDITVGNAFEELADLESMALIPAGEGAAPISLGEVAEVERTTAAATSASRTDGRDSVTMLITPAVRANFVDLSEDVHTILDDATETVGGGTEFTVVFDQAPFIQESIEGLATEGGWGLLFAVLVIFGFLLAVRPTIITAISIPLSLLFAFVGMWATGTTMNMLSLAGIILAIGRMVDDSIVVIENIVRHMQASTRSRYATIVHATSEVAGAVISSTLVALLVFLPIVLVSGLAGELFRPFALTTVVALTGSLLVSLTIVPVLAYWFLGRQAGRTADASPESVVGEPDDDGAPLAVEEDATAEASQGWLARAYRPALGWAITHRAATVVLVLLVFVGSMAMIPLLKVNLLGDSGMNMVSVTQTLAPGTTLEESIEAAEDTEEIISAQEGVQTVQTSIGGGGFGFGFGSSTNRVSYTVITEPGADQEALQTSLEAALAEHADADESAGEIEFSEAGGGGGMLGSSTVDVRLQALDDASRTEASDAVVEALQELDGVETVTSDDEAIAPALEIRIREADAAAMGMSVTDAVGLIAVNTADFPVGSVSIGGTELSVYLDTGGAVETVQDVEDLDLGGLPLSAIADVERVEVAPSISTVDAVRTVTVSVTPDSDDVGALGGQVRSAMEGLTLPDGVTWEMGGVTADIDETFTQLGLAMLAAILLIYVVLVWLFKSLIQPVILMMSIPFAATGVVLALWATGTSLGLSSLVGLLMLIGIVVTNSIMLIDLVNQYRRRGMELDEAIMRGGQNRVRPIIMTAAATIGAMIPPALGMASQSSFVSGPMAIAVIGGLVASTVISLVIVPVLYRMVEGRKERRAQRGRRRADVPVEAHSGDAAADSENALVDAATEDVEAPSGA